jgi:L-asparagine oxygenase
MHKRAAIMGATVMEEINKSLAMRGFFLCHNRDKAELSDICLRLGRVVPSRVGVAAIRDISPQSLPERMNTLSSRYGLGPFPFHTDTAFWQIPTRYLVLFCSNPGSGSRPTLLIDPLCWVLSSDEERMLGTSVWRTTRRPSFLCSLVARRRGNFLLRFDRDCMLAATAQAEQSGRLLEEKIQQSNIIRIDWSVGDLLIFDNHRFLHARGSALRADGDRVLTRALVLEKK